MEAQVRCRNCEFYEDGFCDIKLQYITPDDDICSSFSLEDGDQE